MSRNDRVHFRMYGDLAWSHSGDPGSVVLRLRELEYHS